MFVDKCSCGIALGHVAGKVPAAQGAAAAAPAHIGTSTCSVGITLCDSGHGNVQRQQTRNKRLPTSHKAVMFQCCPHLTLCRSASTPDSSSTSLHKACSRVSPSSRKPARVEYLHRDTPVNLWGTSVWPAQGSPQGWKSCTTHTHTHSHHGQQLAHDPCKEACKGGGTAPNLKRRVLPHADMLALSYVCWA